MRIHTNRTLHLPIYECEVAARARAALVRFMGYAESEALLLTTHWHCAYAAWRQTPQRTLGVAGGNSQRDFWRWRVRWLTAATRRLQQPFLLRDEGAQRTPRHYSTSVWLWTMAHARCFLESKSDDDDDPSLPLAAGGGGEGEGRDAPFEWELPCEENLVDEGMLPEATHLLMRVGFVSTLSKRTTHRRTDVANTTNVEAPAKARGEGVNRIAALDADSLATVVVRAFEKMLPARCLVRDAIPFITTNMRGSPLFADFMRRLICVSLMGSYHHCSVRATWPMARAIYRTFIIANASCTSAMCNLLEYDAPDNEGEGGGEARTHKYGFQSLVVFILREYVHYMTSQVPALKALLINSGTHAHLVAATSGLDLVRSIMRLNVQHARPLFANVDGVVVMRGACDPAFYMSTALPLDLVERMAKAHEAVTSGTAVRTPGSFPKGFKKRVRAIHILMACMDQRGAKRLKAAPVTKEVVMSQFSTDVPQMPRIGMTQRLDSGSTCTWRLEMVARELMAKRADYCEVPQLARMNGMYIFAERAMNEHFAATQEYPSTIRECTRVVLDALDACASSENGERRERLLRHTSGIDFAVTPQLRSAVDEWAQGASLFKSKIKDGIEETASRTLAGAHADTRLVELMRVDDPSALPRSAGECVVVARIALEITWAAVLALKSILAIAAWPMATRHMRVQLHNSGGEATFVTMCGMCGRIDAGVGGKAPRPKVRFRLLQSRRLVCDRATKDATASQPSVLEGPVGPTDLMEVPVQVPGSVDIADIPARPSTLSREVHRRHSQRVARKTTLDCRQTPVVNVNMTGVVLQTPYGAYASCSQCLRPFHVTSTSPYGIRYCCGQCERKVLEVARVKQCVVCSKPQGAWKPRGPGTGVRHFILYDNGLHDTPVSPHFRVGCVCAVCAKGCVLNALPAKGAWDAHAAEEILLRHVNSVVNNTLGNGRYSSASSHSPSQRVALALFNERDRAQKAQHATPQG